VSNLRLNGREFNLLLLHYWLIGSVTRDCFWAGKPPWCATSHPGQLSLLLSAGWEISAGQSAVMLCWE